MTGTAKTEEVEFEKTYKLETTIVPTNRVRARQDWADQVYKTETAKWRAVANETAEIHKKGRPVLVGTTSVEKSELLSSRWPSTRFPTTCSTPSRRTWKWNRRLWLRPVVPEL